MSAALSTLCSKEASPKCRGARTKDVLENRLHELVCERQLALASAQRQEAQDWVAAYRRYVEALAASGPDVVVRASEPHLHERVRPAEVRYRALEHRDRRRLAHARLAQQMGSEPSKELTERTRRAPPDGRPQPSNSCTSNRSTKLVLRSSSTVPAIDRTMPRASITSSACSSSPTIRLSSARISQRIRRCPSPSAAD